MPNKKPPDNLFLCYTESDLPTCDARDGMHNCKLRKLSEGCDCVELLVYDGLARCEKEDGVDEGVYGRHETDRHILHVPISHGKAWIIVNETDLLREKK